MAMRDGVTLVADIWRPLEGAAPTLLMRTPYDRRTPMMYGGPGSPHPSLISLVNAGYAVVLQDARGTFGSEGKFEPKINEIADGQDTAEWITRQDWSDGTIGMYGASYMGDDPVGSGHQGNARPESIAPPRCRDRLVLRALVLKGWSPVFEPGHPVERHDVCRRRTTGPGKRQDN